MNWLFLIFFVVIAISFIIFFKKSKKEKEKEMLPYKRRVYLLTRTENKFFKILEEIFILDKSPFEL